MPNASYHTCPDKGHFVGKVNLDEQLSNLEQLNLFFVRQQITLAECYILLQSRSSIHNEQVLVPAFVNKVLKHIDCQLRFINIGHGQSAL